MKTFKIGGVHPEENKFSAGKRIIDTPLPKQVIIPLAAYIGAPSVPVVAKGDQVKVGQLVGKAGGYVSSNVHSSVSGKVAKIEPALDASGYKRMSMFIDVEGDEWLDTIESKLHYERWYCGHYHTEKRVDKLRFMFEDYALLPHTLSIEEEKALIAKMERQAEMMEALGWDEEDI